MARKSTTAKRTKSGAPSAKARATHGGGKGLKKGGFPVFDARSARSARPAWPRQGNLGRKTVLNKVSRFASKTNNATLKAQVKRARAADKKR